MNLACLGAMAAVLLVVAAPAIAASAFCDRPEPFTAPAGWVHLAEYTTDGWGGSYHDAESGAFISYEFHAGPPLTVMAEAGDAYQEEQRPERTIRTWIGPNARRRYEAMLDELASHSMDPSNARKSVKDLIPPRGAAMLIIALVHSSGSAWVFNAAVADSRQEGRVRQWLTGDDPFAARSSGADCIPRDSVAVVMDDVNALAHHSRVQAVIAALGPPLYSRRSGAKGFWIQYRVSGHASRTNRVRITFDQSQKLVKKQVD